MEPKREDAGEAPVSVSVEVSDMPPDWSALLAEDEEAGIYHDPRWGALMRRCYGNRSFYLTARRGETLAGGLLLVEKKSWLFRSHLCSVPYFDAVGVIGADEAAREALLAEAETLRQRRHAAYVELRQVRPTVRALPRRTDKVTLWLTLPGDAEVLWRDLKAKVRNQVRRPEKAGMRCEPGGAELLDAFHGIYVRNMRDLGSPPHGKRFFRLIAETFDRHVRFYVVRLGDRPVAASLTLSDATAVHVPWAGSDWRYRKQCPNYMLYWAMLRDACGHVGRFDFGRSTRGAGTQTFKQQWGAAEIPLYWQYLLPPDATMPAPMGDQHGRLVRCWQKLPLWAARALGPPIIAKLS